MDHRAVANMAEMTEATTAISALKAQLAEANQLLKDWKISVDVEVKPEHSQFFIVIKSEAGGRVYQEMISPSTIQYYYDDKDSIIRTMADNILVSLLRERLIEKLDPKLSKAMQNVYQLTKGFTT